MLNIPDEVKALCSSDIVHKNFHVHFPDGEYTDLNNENVISESVKFTESLCSQQYFKFGLAEASQIEFTAVGIPNIRGAYIECAIEIDCTRLGSAWAAAHPVDSSLPFLTPQSCEYSNKLYYRIPYGRFKVDTCPRDHGAMWQRKITAYSMTANDVINNEFIQKKDAVFGTSKVYKPSIQALIYSVAFMGNADALLNYGYSKSTYAGTDQGGTRYSTNGYAAKASDNTQILVIVENMKSLLQSGSNQDFANPYAIMNVHEVPNYGEVLKPLISQALQTSVSGKAIDPVASGFADWDAFVDYLWTRQIKGIHLLPEFFLGPAMNIPVSKSTTAYLQRDGFSTYFYSCSNTVNVKLSAQGTNITVPITFDGVPLDIYTPTTPSFFDTMYFNFNNTLKTKMNGQTVYSFANAYSLNDILIGFLELSGLFLKPDRYGYQTFFEMSDNATAIPVSAADWSEFWWDETPIDSIGLVNVIYTQDGEEQQQSFKIGDGNSVYTIENNEVLKSAELDETTMQSILTTYFEPNASVINFTPVELEMRGLPYLESGDYIELTAEDGETVQTYILAQTISGIQNLRADVTSTTGDLLEVRDE